MNSRTSAIARRAFARRSNPLIVFAIVGAVILLVSGSSFAQKKQKKNAGDETLDTLNALVKRGEWQFPVHKMFDDALEASEKSHRPVLAFNIDYTVGTESKYVNDTLLRDPDVMIFLTKNFELALHDYSVDPPPSVGLDSLRTLGHRLDLLEKSYRIATRPTAILVNSDGSEIERIPELASYTSTKFIETVKEYIAGKNTVTALRKDFWSDPKNLETHKAYLNRLMMRADYDSVIYHLHLLATDPSFGQTPDVMKDAEAHYAFLRFKQEGNVEILRGWLSTLDQNADSAEIVAGLTDILDYYRARKKMDSAGIAYENIFAFTRHRDPDLLNNYAWDLANFSRRWDSALVLINEAIAQDGKNANYYDTRALIEYQKQDCTAAIADAKLALKHAADDKKYFKERIEFYEKEKKRISSEK